MACTTVCSMCGDVGFPDKLFRCARCRRRFQHSYVRRPNAFIIVLPLSHSYLLLQFPSLSD
jgi:hypothetical protein